MGKHPDLHLYVTRSTNIFGHPEAERKRPIVNLALGPPVPHQQIGISLDEETARWLIESIREAAHDDWDL